MRLPPLSIIADKAQQHGSCALLRGFCLVAKSYLLNPLLLTGTGAVGTRAISATASREFGAVTVADIDDRLGPDTAWVNTNT